MNSAETENYYNRLATICNFSSDDARALLAGYNTGDKDFFENFFKKLKTVKIKKNDVPNNSVNETLFIKNNNAISGAYGNVVKNKTQSFVYKSLKQEETDRFDYLKALFKEILVQTALQSDEVNGKYICKLNNVYRDGEKCILKLEQLDKTLFEVFYSTNEASLSERNRRSKTLRDILIHLYTILDHFLKKYEFMHYDLHYKNIMTVKSPNFIEDLRIIDFGLSRIKIDNIIIGDENFLADGYNIANFVNLLGNLSDNFQANLLEIMQKPDGTPYAEYISILQKPTENIEGGSRKSRKTKRHKKHRHTRRLKVYS